MNRSIAIMSMSILCLGLALGAALIFNTSPRKADQIAAAPTPTPKPAAPPSPTAPAPVTVPFPSTVFDPGAVQSGQALSSPPPAQLPDRNQAQPAKRPAPGGVVAQPRTINTEQVGSPAYSNNQTKRSTPVNPGYKNFAAPTPTPKAVDPLRELRADVMQTANEIAGSTDQQKLLGLSQYCQSMVSTTMELKDDMRRHGEFASVAGAYADLARFAYNKSSYGNNYNRNWQRTEIKRALRNIPQR